MSKITLEVEDKNLDTVLTILKSIKSELITNIVVDETVLAKKPYKYVPKNGIKQKLPNENTPITGAISLKNDYIKNLNK